MIGMYRDVMVEYGIATEEELDLACALCGTSIETMKNVLSIRTGYCNIDQLIEDCKEEEEEE